MTARVPAIGALIVRTKAIAATVAALLAGDAILVVELGSDQAEPVAALIAAAGLAPVALQSDLNGVPRVLIAENVLRQL